MKDDKADLKRRHFLLSLGAGGTGAVAAAVAATGRSTPLAAPVAEAVAEAKDQGVSEHMRNYYRSARI
jgi:hypothetical protein